MSVVQEAMHLVNLFLFAMCVPAYIWCIFEAIRCDKPTPIRVVAIVICVCAIALSFMFLILQTSWSGLSYRWAIPMHSSWTWMLYDYLIACYMLCVASVVKIYCAWQGKLRNVSLEDRRNNRHPTRRHRRYTDAGP